tara:strand:+ start:923 stop:1171 length:249 start_codon:yes stop_codon:yes gene_type:complete
MSCYDPRELNVRLQISRNYNVEITKQRDKIKIEYKKLLDQYHELVKYFVMDKPQNTIYSKEGKMLFGVCDECLDKISHVNLS